MRFRKLRIAWSVITYLKPMVAFALLASIYAVGCTKPPSTPKPADVGPCYIAPSESVGRMIDGIRYEYIAAQERKDQIIDGFPKLKVGQSREEVRAALGLPDTARPRYSKAYNAQFLGWSYDYKINNRSDGANMNDAYVGVFFNPDGQLTWAVPNSIAGLQEVGNPSGQ